jgi:glucokinase
MSASFPRLLGDIGGTNARFALHEAPGAGPSQERSLPTAGHAGMREAMAAYLADIIGPRPQHAAIGIATAVLGDRLEMTNLHWQFSIAELRAQLGFETLRFFNDFTALAHSLPVLRPDELVQIGGGAADGSATIALLGPGTGLGVSGLVPSAAGHLALAGEGGHVTLPALDAWDEVVLAELRTAYPHVSAERVLSGPGLVALHRAISTLMAPGEAVVTLSPAEIAERGLQRSCDICRRTLEDFCGFLGSVAGNLALTLGARGGVYIGGGIVPRFGDFFAASPFRARFEAKGRFSTYLRAIPTYVITAENPTFRGLIRVLDEA